MAAVIANVVKALWHIRDMCGHRRHVGRRPLKNKTELRDKTERTFCFNSSSETFIHCDEHFSGA